MGKPKKRGGIATRQLLIEFTDGSSVEITVAGQIRYTTRVPNLPGRDVSCSFAHRFMAGSPNVGSKVSYAAYGAGPDETPAILTKGENMGWPTRFDAAMKHRFGLTAKSAGRGG